MSFGSVYIDQAEAPDASDECDKLAPRVLAVQSSLRGHLLTFTSALPVILLLLLL